MAAEDNVTREFSRKSSAQRLKKRIREAASRAELLPLVTNGLTEHFGAEACAIFARDD
jgi:hypothetical protein